MIREVAPGCSVTVRNNDPHHAGYVDCGATRYILARGGQPEGQKTFLVPHDISEIDLGPQVELVLEPQDAPRTRS